MSKRRLVAIMAYGKESDRLRAAAVAKLNKKSTSEWLLGLIRENYSAVYGEIPPEKLNVDSDQRSSA